MNRGAVGMGRGQQMPQLNSNVHIGQGSGLNGVYSAYQGGQNYQQYEASYQQPSHNIQRQPQVRETVPHQHTTFGEGEDVIVEVWAQQLEDAFEHIRKMVVDYPYIAMDTEFPGVVARPVGNFKSNTEFYYQTLRCNVNLLKIIQLGITFSNEAGEHPPGPCTWQFNFKFDLKDDIYAQDSIDLLSTSGIDFNRFARGM